MKEVVETHVNLEAPGSSSASRVYCERRYFLELREDPVLGNLLVNYLGRVRHSDFVLMNVAHAACTGKGLAFLWDIDDITIIDILNLVLPAPALAG